MSGVDLGRHPQMGAGGHRASEVHLKPHRRWVSVKDVPSKATSPRQHVSGADRFISAVFQAASFHGGSPWRWRASRFRLLNQPNNPPACFTGRVPVASGVGGGLGASSENGCRGPSGVWASSEASPQVGVCKNRSFQSDAVPSTRQWSRPLYIGRFSGGVVSRRLTLAFGQTSMSTIWNASTYDTERRRLIHCFDEFYGTVVEIVARFCPYSPRILDLGAGTGILSAAIIHRVPTAQLQLLDASPDMLRQAANRLVEQQPRMFVQPLNADLPHGPFDAIVSALAIHHLNNTEKHGLYSRILSALSPGGIFINAEQVSGHSSRLQNLFEAVHLDRARELGSSEQEISEAVQRMSYDQCATVTDQVAWLTEIGFEDAECFFRSFRFAVFGAWKPRP